MNKALLSTMRLAASIRAYTKQLRSGKLTDAEYDAIEVHLAKAQTELRKLFTRKANARLRNARGDP